MDKQIFVSYSHEDKDWLNRLIAALAPLVRAGETEIWADTMIQPGEDWQKRLDDQIGRSNVAVLLVSTWFFYSDFITDVELPRVLHAAEQGRLTLVWVPVSASLWEATELRKFQAAIDPHRPLNQMTDAEAQQALVTIAKLIGGARTLTDIGQAMHIIDQSYDGLAQQAGQDPRTSPYRIVARHTGTSVAFQPRDEPNRPVEVITAEDLARLPVEEHRLIQALEARMSNEYERWAKLYPKVGSLTDSERDEYQTAGRIMCTQLQRILDFLSLQLGKNLEDHYNGVRYTCREIVEKET